MFLLFAPTWSYVQQQYLKTTSVQQDALAQPSGFPSLANKQQDSNPWTNNNPHVRKDSKIIVEFNEVIQVGLGYITFQPPIAGLGTSTAAATTITVPSSDALVSGQSLIINNAEDVIFAESIIYTMSIDAGVVEDTNVPVDTNAAFSIQFTTGDFTKPSLLSTAPATGSNAVGTSSNIVLTFSENIQAYGGSGTMPKATFENSYKRPPQDDAGDAYRWVPECTDAAIVISGKTATLTLGTSTMALLPCQNYKFIYEAYCFTDTSASRNWVEALTGGNNYNFWTSCITQSSPVPSTFGHLISTDIVLTFAEAVGRGTGSIVLTPLGESPISFDITDGDKVLVSGTEVTVKGTIASNNYLCGGLTMQNCKGKPIDVTLGAGVIERTSVASPSPTPTPLPTALTEQLVDTEYRFTLKAADLTPPEITIVSMYSVSETTILDLHLSRRVAVMCRL
jgi:hypothetical protein